jgi:hypothetical protein
MTTCIEIMTLDLIVNLGWHKGEQVIDCGTSGVLVALLVAVVPVFAGFLGFYLTHFATTCLTHVCRHRWH